MVIVSYAILLLLFVSLSQSFFTSKSRSSTQYIAKEGLVKNNENCQGQRQIRSYFKKTDNDNNSSNDKENTPSFLERIKRFLPWTQRVKMEKTYAEVMPSTGMRYHLRLLNPNDLNLKRHIITRILRYFPDITWETAETMVVQANNEGAVLLRVLNSQRDCKYFVDMFRNADPPIAVEVFDTKTEEILSI